MTKYFFVSFCSKNDDGRFGYGDATVEINEFEYFSITKMRNGIASGISREKKIQKK